MTLENKSKYGFDLKSLNDGASDFWTQSSVTTEYYYNQTDLGKWPIRVLANSIGLSEGTLGSLAVDEYAIGDNDTLGEDALYIRLTGDADPDTQVADFIQVDDVFDLIENAVGEQLMIMSFLAGNHSAATVNFVIYFTNDADIIYHKIPQALTTSDGPWALNVKAALNDGDKVKVQADGENFSIMMSLDRE